MELEGQERGTFRVDSALTGSIKTEELEMEEMVAAQPSAINAETIYQGSDSRSSRRAIYRQSRRVKQVAQQCFLYAAAFYINWVALTVRTPMLVFA